MDTTDGELETSLGRTRLGFSRGITTSSLARLGFSANFARHVLKGEDGGWLRGSWWLLSDESDGRSRG